MAALLPCPFCGAEAHRSTYMDEDLATHDQVEWVRIACVNCGVPTSASPHGYDTTAEGEWNRRAGPTCPACNPQRDERIAELEAALQPFANLGHEIEQLAASAPAGDPASDVSNWAKACFWEDLASAMRALKPTTPAE